MKTDAIESNQKEPKTFETAMRRRKEYGRMIRGILFDLGGTLHVNDSPPGRDVWFARRLIDRMEDYGIHLQGTPEMLAARLHENSEAYKRASEENLRELPAAEIWSRWFLREQDLTHRRSFWSVPTSSAAKVWKIMPLSRQLKRLRHAETMKRHRKS